MGGPRLPLLPPAPVHLLGTDLGVSWFCGRPLPLPPCLPPPPGPVHTLGPNSPGWPPPHPRVSAAGRVQAELHPARDGHTDFHPRGVQAPCVPARSPNACPPPAVRSRPKQVQGSRPQPGLSGTLQGSKASPAVCPGSSSQASRSPASAPPGLAGISCPPAPSRVSTRGKCRQLALIKTPQLKR